MELSLELMTLIGIIALIVIILLIMSIKDSETTKKLSRFEQSIDNLAQQNHDLKKEIHQLSTERDTFIAELELVLDEKIKDQIQHSMYPLVQSLNEIETLMQNFQDEQMERIENIEVRRKETNYTPLHATTSNEKLIIAQYNEGKKESLIAKDLRIGIGEVELVLKLANLKQ